MEGGVRRSKRQRGDVVDLSDDDGKESDAKLLRIKEERRKLEEEKRQWEEEKRQLKEDKGQLEGEKRRLDEEKWQLEEEKSQLQEVKGQLEGEKRQLKEDKSQLEGEKGQLEEDKGLLEMERDQTKNILKEHASLVECPVCLMLPREDKAVPCCPQGHFVCSTCKDKLIRQGGVSISFAKKGLFDVNFYLSFI